MRKFYLIAKKHSYMEIGRTLVLLSPRETSVSLFSLKFLSLLLSSPGGVNTGLGVGQKSAFPVCSVAP